MPETRRERERGEENGLKIKRGRFKEGGDREEGVSLILENVSNSNRGEGRDWLLDIPS